MSDKRKKYRSILRALSRSYWSDVIEAEKQGGATIVKSEVAEALDFAQALVGKERCEHCDCDKMYYGPPNCYRCGAPNCCEICCKMNTLEMERDTALAEAERLRGELVKAREENAHGG